MLRTKSAAALAGVTSDHVFTHDDATLAHQAAVDDEAVWVRNVAVRLQEGVTCGLVCLAMAADYARNHCRGDGVRFPTLLQAAIDASYTAAGEMFDAHQMAALARDVLGLRANATTTPWTVHRVAQHIARGGVCLVAYDCAKNFEPFAARGSKSHWCVVVGFSVADRPRTVTVLARGEAAPLQLRPDEDRIERLVCVQPKSRRVAVWNATALRDSNAQLQRSDEFGKDDLEGKLRHGVVWIDIV